MTHTDWFPAHCTLLAVRWNMFSSKCQSVLRQRPSWCHVPWQIWPILQITSLTKWPLHTIWWKFLSFCFSVFLLKIFYSLAQMSGISWRPSEMKWERKHPWFIGLNKETEATVGGRRPQFSMQTSVGVIIWRKEEEKFCNLVWLFLQQGVNEVISATEWIFCLFRNVFLGFFSSFNVLKTFTYIWSVLWMKYLI